MHGASTPTQGCTCTLRANVYQQRTGLCSVWNKELIIKLTNYCTGFITFSGIICMNFASLVNNPVTVINKTEIGG